MIASHYAEPADRTTAHDTELRRAPGGEVIGRLRTGEAFLMLDDSLGWAWGYAGPDRRVGYVRSDSVGP